MRNNPPMLRILPAILLYSCTLAPIEVEFTRGFEPDPSFGDAVSALPPRDGPGDILSALTMDTDGDGDLDILFTIGAMGGGRQVWLMTKTGTTWDMPVLVTGIQSALAVSDINGDGLLDLVTGDPLGVVYGAFDGLGDFTTNLVTVRNTTGVTVRDFDGDGLPDIAATGRDDPDMVIYQDVGGWDVVELGEGQSFAPCPVDFDETELPDLIILTDGEWQLSNQGGGAWLQVAPRQWEQRLPQGWTADSYLSPTQDEKGTPMSCADLEHSGGPGLWLSQTSEAPVLYSGGRNRAPQTRGIPGYPETAQDFEVFWGSAGVDFDGDGWDDIAVAGGNDESFRTTQGDGNSRVSLFIQRENGYAEVSGQVGLPSGGDYFSLIADDFNGDGKPDVLVGGFGTQEPMLYLNHLEPYGAHLILEFVGTSLGGMRVDIEGRDRSWTEHIGGEAQPFAGGRPIIIRGVGDETNLDVTVHWPSGPQTIGVSPQAEPWVLLEN